MRIHEGIEMDRDGGEREKERGRVCEREGEIRID